ncbi:hypothetical protein DSO57_1033118 [Entomophthora muscae]|uniref:Uncharacterized protein n=1 Tax=Entomophthora muscae TaxID=34485 RepID=A0ACC2SPB6_9FUNG|nr:hypothetical protein DSO57_1033118 [Entomophthora muscae]
MGGDKIIWVGNFRTVVHVSTVRRQDARSEIYSHGLLGGMLAGSVGRKVGGIDCQCKTSTRALHAGS